MLSYGIELPGVTILYHFFYGAAGSTIRAYIFHNGHLDFTPVVFELHNRSRRQLRLYLDKTATKTAWRKVFGFVGAGNADNFAFMITDPHIGYTG